MSETCVDVNREVFEKIMDVDECQKYINAPFISFDKELKIVKENVVGVISYGSLNFNFNFLNMDFIEAFVQRYENVLSKAIPLLSNKEYVELYHFISYFKTLDTDSVLKDEIINSISISKIVMSMFSQDNLILRNNGRNIKKFLLDNNNENLGVNLIKESKAEEYKWVSYYQFKSFLDKHVHDEDLEETFMSSINIGDDGKLFMLMKIKNIELKDKHKNQLAKIAMAKYNSYVREVIMNNHNSQNTRNDFYEEIPIDVYEIEVLDVKDLKISPLKSLPYLMDLWDKRMREERGNAMLKTLNKVDNAKTAHVKVKL